MALEDQEEAGSGKSWLAQLDCLGGSWLAGRRGWRAWLPDLTGEWLA